VSAIEIARTSAATAEIYGHYSVTARVDGEEVTRTVAYADDATVRVDCGEGRMVDMSWTELREAADQTDEVSTVYRSILALATQRRDHYAHAAQQARLFADAKSGKIWIYVSAEQDSTNVWWVSTVRAGSDGYASAKPLDLRGHPIRIYGAADGGTHASRRLAMSEANDIASRIRSIYPNAKVVEVQS